MLLATITGLARVLPLPIGYRVADLASEAHRLLSPARRIAVEENLDFLTGGQTPPGAVSGAFRNYGRSLLELLRGPDLPEIRCLFEGRGHLEAARSRGRGAVVCLPHTGSWSVSGAQLAREGLPITAVAGVQLSKRWTPELRRRQRAGGLRVIGAGVSSSREMIRLLRRNEVLALLVDGDVFRGGVPVDIAGRRVAFPVGPARLAARTGAALIPAFGRRNPDGTLSFTFLPEVRPGQPDGPATAMREVAAQLDEALRQEPAQWMIFRRFFAGSRPAAVAATPVVDAHPAGIAA